MAGFGKGLIGGLMAGIAGLSVLALTVEPPPRVWDAVQADADGEAGMGGTGALRPAAKAAPDDSAAARPDADPPAAPEDERAEEGGEESAGEAIATAALIGLTAGPDLARAIAFSAARHRPVIQPLSPSRPVSAHEAASQQAPASVAAVAAAGSLLTPYLPALPPIDVRPVPAGEGDPQLRLSPDIPEVPEMGRKAEGPTGQAEAPQSGASPAPDRMHGPTRIETASSRAGLLMAAGATLLTGPGHSAQARLEGGAAAEPSPPVTPDAMPRGPLANADTAGPGESPLPRRPASGLARLIPGLVVPDIAPFPLSDLLVPAALPLPPLSAMAGAGMAMLSEAGGNRAYPAPDLSIPPDYSAMTHDESLR